MKTAAQITKKLCYENKDALMAGMIIAGWDPSKGGSVYEVRSSRCCRYFSYA